MSLDFNVLKSGLVSVFQDMSDDRRFAQGISEKIASYAQSGAAQTVDAGTIAGGAFSGTGSGSITVNAALCENIIYAACMVIQGMTAGGNAYLAAQMALGIDTMMSAGTVNTSVVGTVVTPAGVPSAMAGVATGRFSGVSMALRTGFLAAFTAMDAMTEGGDEYLAAQIALAVTGYLTSGVVTTQGQANLAGSIGNGLIS